jgi:type IV secretory pathway VirB10-like protein
LEFAMNSTTPAHLLAASALMACAALAHAQYLWIDEKGIKQFSDRAPPPSVPLKNILKAPAGVPRAPDVAAEAPAAAAAAAKPKEPASLADRNADYDKRAKQAAEREQKEKDELQAKRDKAQNCAQAQAASAAIASGVRINLAGPNGERGFMSDEQRAVEAARVNRVIAACK